MLNYLDGSGLISVLDGTSTSEFYFSYCLYALNNVWNTNTPRRQVQLQQLTIVPPCSKLSCSKDSWIYMIWNYYDSINSLIKY